MNSASKEEIKKGVVLFASGAGSNAANIMHYFRKHPHIEVRLVVSNNPAAGVLQKAEAEDVPALVFTAEDWKDTDTILSILDAFHPDLIVLAGYLALLPPAFVAHYAGRIINLHPALLPAYGGKGMYGRRVHQRVAEHGEKESGITIHEVDAEYDHGKILFRKKIALLPGDDADAIEKKVRGLEYKWLPLFIESMLMHKAVQNDA